MVKKQFLVTMLVDDKTIAKKNTNYSINYDSVEEYIYREMDCLANKYENVNSFEQGIKEWGEWIEYKEITEDDTCPKCDQYPYSDTDKHCPVCFDEIKEKK